MEHRDLVERGWGVHGDKYTYTAWEGVRKTTDPVSITCPKHGDFLFPAHNHLRGTGCPACTRDLRGSKLAMKYEQFVIKAAQVHGGLYKYPVWAEGENANSSIKIVCQVHGEFEQKGTNHLHGKGCAGCGRLAAAEKRRLPFPAFVDEANLVHRGKYEYPEQHGVSLVLGKVTVICPEHGEFRQQGYAHLKGHGCDKCAGKVRAEKRSKSYTTFVAKARKVHGDTYDYPSWGEAQKASGRVPIRCKVHGEFTQFGSTHLGGGGCGACGRSSTAEKLRVPFEEFVTRARELHGDTYDYPVWGADKGVCDRLPIVCPEHGAFEQEGAVHLTGAGCPACGQERTATSRRIVFSEFVARARAVHGDTYEYLPWGAKTQATSQVKMVCPLHGEFRKKGTDHLQGQGCQLCSKDAAVKRMRTSFEDFVVDATDVHNSKFAYEDWGNYERGERSVVAVCPDHGRFTVDRFNHLRGHDCPLCARRYSKAEFAVRDFVRSLGFDTGVGNNKSVPGVGRQQLDIIVPEKRVAIEYNGLVWHSERFKKDSKTSHLKKTELAESLGYRLVHIFEDEWLEKPELVKNRLRAILGAGLTKLHARATQAAKIDWRQASAFLSGTHLQGHGPSSKNSFGLFHKNELVAVATFAKSRYTKDDWELLRFAATARVVGGMSKLLSAFKRDARPTGTLISYADRRWSDGGLYRAMGFEFAGHTSPNYFYEAGGKRFSREKFQKHKLEATLNKFDSSLTEVANCANNGFYRIFDCGSSRWRLKL